LNEMPEKMSFCTSATTVATLPISSPSELYTGVPLSSAIHAMGRPASVMVGHLRGPLPDPAAAERNTPRVPLGKRAKRFGLTVAMLLLTGCAAGTVTKGRPPTTGPPRVQPAVVQRHAQWFDRNDPSRPAGSQGELVAGSYLLARLEQAGYLVKLDPVPVGNLLHSTNVIALAPSGTSSTVIVVNYDTAPAVPSDGAAIGTFLEVARALRVMEPLHSVEFAALGAEHVNVDGGQVGSRSLIELLKQQSSRPQIIRLADVANTTGPISAAGPAAASLRRAAEDLHIHLAASGTLSRDVFASAGFRETVIQGGPTLGPVLLSYLRHE
jgi:hypothetical protein